MIENKLSVVEESKIRSLIYEIRGKQVMLDSDVARLYNYETRTINQTVKRNIKRFPDEFCFQLTISEYEILLSKIEILTGNQEKIIIDDVMRSQNVIGPQSSKRNVRFLPYVFTEQGIAMLSGLLKNDIAIEISIKIMKAFVDMRNFIISNKNLFERVITIENKMDHKFIDYDKKFDAIFNEFQKEQIVKEKIFYNGQIYDAYSLLVDLVKRANASIVIIDNYIDKTILDLLSKKNKNVDVTIITSKMCKLSDLDIAKFNEQYPKLKIKYSLEYHDRFIIIDNCIYHCGASLKDLGKKCFAITKMEDESLVDKLLIHN